MNELLPIDDEEIEALEAEAERSLIVDVEAEAAERLMLSDLKFVNGVLEPEDDPTPNDVIELCGHVTLPVLEPREPEAVPMVAPGSPTPVQFVGRPLRPVPPLFTPGGTPPGPAEMRQALRGIGEELIDHGRMLIDLSLRDEEPAGYVARVLEYRSSDVSGVATKLGMLGRLFARLGVGGNGKGA